MARMKDAERLLRLRLFELYRDMGKGRTYDRLIIAAEKTHGLMTKRQIASIAKQDRWQDRIAEHDKANELPAFNLDPQFDRVDHLLRAAHLALARALADQSLPPQQMKALVDTAEKAIRLCEKLRELGVDRRGDMTPAEAQHTLRNLMAFVKRRVREKHALEGNPVVDHVVDATFEEVKVEQQQKPVMDADVKAIAAPTEKPLQPAVKSVEQPVVEAVKPLSMADRLKRMGR